MSIALSALHHVGIVVADAEAAALGHERRWGVTAGPIIDLSFSQALLSGVPTDVSARYRFIDTGASQIELIEPASQPSPTTNCWLSAAAYTISRTSSTGSMSTSTTCASSGSRSR